MISNHVSRNKQIIREKISEEWQDLLESDVPSLNWLEEDWALPHFSYLSFDRREVLCLIFLSYDICYIPG